MQQTHFTYDELTPLEQCIAEFMARQRREQSAEKKKNDAPRRELLNA